MARPCLVLVALLILGACCASARAQEPGPETVIVVSSVRGSPVPVVVARPLPIDEDEPTPPLVLVPGMCGDMPWCDRDEDGDGVADQDDRCLGEPEDHDEHDDLDGCPDPDDDLDGVPDSDDACPDFAENLDGRRDHDGCPEARSPPRRAQASRPVVRRPPSSWLDVAVAIASSHRRLTVNGVDSRRRYSTPTEGFLEAGVEVTVMWPTLPYLGVTLEYWRALALETRCDEPGALCTPGSIDTDQHELLAAATGRVRTGRGARAPELTGLLGYGEYVFELSPSTIVATHAYRYVFLEGRARVPISSAVSLTLAAFGRTGNASVGDRSEAGQPLGLGVRAGLRLDLPFLLRGLHAAARMDWCDFITALADDTPFGLAAADDQVYRFVLLFSFSAERRRAHRSAGS